MRGSEPAYRTQIPTPLEPRLARLATRQKGLVTHRQLRAIGFSASAINRRVEAGRVHPVHRGVYAVGHVALTLDARRLAAVMACGPTALLGHRSVLLLFGLVDGRDGPFHVIASSDRGRQAKGIRHHRASPDSRDRTRRDGIPITTPARALLDAAPSLSTAELQLAVDRAAQRGLHDQIASLISRSPGHRGLKPLRGALERTFADADRTRFDFELQLRRLLADRPDLAQPLANVPIGPYEVDFLWPAQRVIVEADGFGSHGRAERERFEDDRRRTADLQALGFTALRFTWRQLTEDPAWIVGHLHQALNR